MNKKVIKNITKRKWRLTKCRFANLSLAITILFFISVTFYLGGWTLFLKSTGAMVVLIIGSMLLSWIYNKLPEE